jgi:hypothetical protein
MTNDKITITDALTGETIEREMTSAEQADRDAFLLKVNSDAQAMAEKETTKVAEKSALLEKLGITEDEAKLLLG